MTLAAREKVARLDRVINDAQANVETILFGEDALVIGLQAGVGDDDGSPARPDIDRKFNYRFAVTSGLGIIAYPGHRWDARAIYQRRGVRPDEQGHVGGRFLDRLNGLADFIDVN